MKAEIIILYKTIYIYTFGKKRNSEITINITKYRKSKKENKSVNKYKNKWFYLSLYPSLLPCTYLCIYQSSILVEYFTGLEHRLNFKK